jgi:hypothetical protein
MTILGPLSFVCRLVPVHIRHCVVAISMILWHGGYYDVGNIEVDAHIVQFSTDSHYEAPAAKVNLKRPPKDG